MFKTTLIIVMATLCLNLNLKAQEPAKAPPLKNQAILGKVIAATTGEAIPGAIVTVRGTRHTVLSNDKGAFILSLPNGNHHLSVSHLSYKTKTLSIQVPLKESLVITIEAEENALDEIQIIGYGETTKRLNTGSVSSITAKEIEKQPVTNTLSALQGRLSGVQITQNSGVPGGGFSVRIRGQNSLRTSANNPLYIVDGVPFTATTLSSVVLMSNNITGINASPLVNINPADIERIDVLKDADATSIYGSRGANGVVLITTKRGRQSKIKVDLQASTGFGNVAKRMKLLNTSQYLQMRKEAFENDGASPGTADYDLNGKWDQNSYTDWQDLLIGGTAQVSNLQASVSGGNGQTSFLFGFGRNKENTVFPGNFYFNRSSAKLAVTHKDANDRFKADFNVNYSGGLNSLLTNSLELFINTIPNSPSIYDKEGKLNWADKTFNNPLAQLEKKYKADTKTFQGNMLLSYVLFKGLEIKSTFGYTSMQMNEVQTTPLTSLNPADYDPIPANRSSKFNDAYLGTWIIEPQVNYQTNLGPGKLAVLLGATFQHDEKQNKALTTSGFPSDLLLENIGSASSVLVSNSSLSVYKYNALFGRLNYQLMNKYIFNFTGRRDGSSRFGPGKQFANFYAAALSWIFSEEQWIKNIIPVLSFGKFKSSYGTSGNDQIGDYQFLNTWSSTTYPYAGNGGIAPLRLFNPDFAWEVNRKFEAGLELGFLADKLLFTANYYRNLSSNQLVGYALAPSVGFTSVQSNLNALIQNTGTEFTLSFSCGSSKKLVWNSSVNLSIPKNKLLKYPGFEGSSYVNTYEVGESLNLEKAFRFTGIDAVTGIYSFEDQNADGKIVSPADLVNDKNLGQRYHGGFQNSLSYGNWNLDVFFQYVNQTARDYTLSFNLAPGRRSNQPDVVLDHWSRPQDQARVQKYTQSSGSAASLAYTNYRTGTGSVTEASFLRLKNVSLSYNLPGGLLKKLHIQNCRLFMQGQNLLSFSKYQGMDPETLNLLPPLRIFTTGITINL